MGIYKFKFFNAMLHESDEWYGSFKPDLRNRMCPYCHSHPLMLKVSYKAFHSNKIEYKCPACEEIIDEDLIITATHDDLTVVEMKEATTMPIPFDEENLSSIAKGLREAKNKKVRVLVEGDDQKEFVVPPKSRPTTYTYEFLEEARESARILATPLKRRNIYVREDDMQSQCPTCGGMLYEGTNMIFSYCPWCAQALNKNFSDDGE